MLFNTSSFTSLVIRSFRVCYKLCLEDIATADGQMELPLFFSQLDDLFCWHQSIHHSFYIWLVVLLLAGHVAKQPLQVLVVLPNMNRACMGMLSRCNWQQRDPPVWLIEVQYLKTSGIFLLPLPLQMWLPPLMMTKVYLPVLMKKKLEYCY